MGHAILLLQVQTQHRMNNKAFTLIELLVAISIIGILATLVSANLNSIRSRARDTARKSDLKQYSISLESFANINNGLYPSYTIVSGTQASADLCTGLSMTNCPDDPLLSPDPTYPPYKYISDGTGAGATDATVYVLWAKLESGTSDWWILCSTGKVGLATAAPVSNSCPL